MSRKIQIDVPVSDGEVLSIEQLEAGLRVMGSGDGGIDAFWDQNVTDFRRTVLLSIRETSDALLSPRIPARWQVELESQLEELVRYLELADRYIERRSLVPTQTRRAIPLDLSVHRRGMTN